VLVRFEEVDGNGVLPLDAAPAGAPFATALAFRRFLQGALPRHLAAPPRVQSVTPGELPAPPPLPAPLLARWPAADEALLEGRVGLEAFPIDHAVAPTAATGGEAAARRRLAAFVAERLPGYAEARNHPDDDAGSGLSPYLHFGHLSAHEVVAAVLAAEGWTSERMARTRSGSKEGWCGASRDAEALLDQLVTWRELSFNMADRRPDAADYDALPFWAQQTLERHASDPRRWVYGVGELARAATHDPLWNAAQRQLASEGRIHNYLRMLWGKKILEWSPTPRTALAAMLELNDRYALDGRDPNSTSGICWVLGRYDRPWPERPIFGTVRCMTSASTARKLRVARYLERFGSREQREQPALF
jgi:deoxyribodipyrimidine photo-lyase